MNRGILKTDFWTKIIILNYYTELANKKGKELNRFIKISQTSLETWRAGQEVF